MKIAFFTDVFLEVPGGIPSSITAERELLEQHGHEVYIFCPGYSNAGDKAIKLVPTNKFLKPNGAPLAKRPSVIVDYILSNYPEIKNFDLFHVHYEAGVSLAGIKLARKLKIPVIQTMHGREDSAAQTNLPFGLKTVGASFLNLLHGRVLGHTIRIRRDQDGVISTLARAKMFEIMVNHANAVDYVLTPSEHFKKKLEKCGVSKPIFVLPNQLPMSILNKRPRLRSFSADRALRIVFNSRVSKEKRLSALLLALSKLPKKYRYKLEVFGDGNEFKKCKRISKFYKLNVKFYGNTPRLKVLEKMDSADLAATVSYDFDTQGMTILEATELGIPSLITDPELAEGLPKDGLFITEDPSINGILKMLIFIFENPDSVRAKSQVILDSKMAKNRELPLTFLDFCDRIGVSAA